MRSTASAWNARCVFSDSFRPNRRTRRETSTISRRTGWRKRAGAFDFRGHFPIRIPRCRAASSLRSIRPLKSSSVKRFRRLRAADLHGLRSIWDRHVSQGPSPDGIFSGMLKKMRKATDKPGSVPLAGRRPLLWDSARAEPRTAYPGVVARRAVSPPLFGLSPGGACRAVPVTRDAVSSYLAISPLPFDAALRRRSGRYVFCGAFPGISPGSR